MERGKAVIGPVVLAILTAIARWRDFDFVMSHTTRPMIAFVMQWWEPVFVGIAGTGIVWALVRPSEAFARRFAFLVAILVTGLICLATGHAASPVDGRRLTDPQIARMGRLFFGNGLGTVTIYNEQKDTEGKVYAEDWKRVFDAAFWRIESGPATGHGVLRSVPPE